VHLARPGTAEGAHCSISTPGLRRSASPDGQGPGWDDRAGELLRVERTGRSVGVDAAGGGGDLAVRRAGEPGRPVLRRQRHAARRDGVRRMPRTVVADAAPRRHPTRTSQNDAPVSPSPRPSSRRCGTALLRNHTGEPSSATHGGDPTPPSQPFLQEPGQLPVPDGVDHVLDEQRPRPGRGVSHTVPRRRPRISPTAPLAVVHLLECGAGGPDQYPPGVGHGRWARRRPRESAVQPRGALLGPVREESRETVANSSLETDIACATTAQESVPEGAEQFEPGRVDVREHAVREPVGQ
jgi:hypothetical protein